MNISSLKTLGRSCGITAVACASLLAGNLQAGETTTTPTTSEASTESWLAKWWGGKYATGNWFGVRDTLEENGLKLSGKWTGVFYGVVDGGLDKKRGGYFDEELAFDGELNFGKLLKVEALESLKAFAGVRWRDGLNPNNRVGASSNFQPSHFQSGKQWRLTTFGLTYSPTLFGKKNFVTLTGGWIRPQKEFIDQPLSKQFVNNTLESSKGIGANIPFSSSYSTWGGTFKIEPVEWYYAKVGLFMSFPSATSTANHGLAFEGYAQEPDLNGLFVIGETGFTPKLGAAELPGKYAVGAYYYEEENTSFFNQDYNGRYGFYWQFDQMVYREPSEEVTVASEGKSVIDGKMALSSSSGKSFKDKVVVEEAKLNPQGLYLFNLITFAPKYNNILPFYFHSGFSYLGLIPGRDNDQLMGAVAVGNYSFYNIEDLQDTDVVNQPNYTVVLEFDYRFQINKWAYLQPYIQYIIQPNGTGAVENATVLGFQTSVTF